MDKKVDYQLYLKLFLSALVPLLIGVFTIITTIQQQRLSTLQRQQDKQEAFLLREFSERQTENLRKENILTKYLDDVSKLLMTDDDEENSLMLIRAKTLSSLRQIDIERKKHLFFFLYDNELIRHDQNKKGSSLLKINDADFNGIRFEGTIGSNCLFSYVTLLDVYLSNALFSNCFIGDSNFNYSKMNDIIFFKTRIARTSFKFAFLNKCTFIQVTLSQVTFSGASLVECNFTSVSWKYTNIDFTNVNMTGAIISNELLSKAILDNAILPNGTWGPNRKRNLVINGNAEDNSMMMNSTSFVGWNISVYGIISRIAYNKNITNFQFGKYHFRVTPFYKLKRAVSMFQYIYFENFTLLISSNMSRYNATIDYQCWGNQYVIIGLTFADYNGLTYPQIYKESQPQTEIAHLVVSGLLHFEVRSVELKIIFFTNGNYSQTDPNNENNYCIVDNIEFYIARNE